MFNNLIRKYYVLTDVELNPGSGGQKIGVDQIAGIDYEVVKTAFGDPGSLTLDSPTNPHPVTDAVAEAALVSIAAEDFATSALQATQIAALAAILAKIIAAPSTEAKQDAANALLTTIAAITQPLTDAQLRATPVPVSGTVTVDTSLLATQATLAAILAKLIANPATDTLQTTGNTTLASILAKIIAAPSTEAKQDTQITALGTLATQATLAAVLAKIITAPSTEAKQDTIITALATLLTISDFDTKTGSLTETAPATDTASSGLNGRLQRIAQRLTSLITALGSPFQAGGSIGNTTFAATQATAANLNMTEASAVAILAKLTAAAASFLKLEDAASASGDAGTPAMAIRKATPANLSDTDGDYEMLQMSGGKLWVQAGATQKPSIGATVVLAVTALQSLASSATVGWQSVRVSNLATLATDYEIFVKLTTANTAPASDKAAYVWLCPWYTTDGGTTWFASSGGTATLPSGTDAAYTIAQPHNLRLLGVLNYSTQQMVLQDTFLLSNCFGARLPDGFSIIITNFTGAALSTGCVVDYSPVNDILV